MTNPVIFKSTCQLKIVVGEMPIQC